MAVKNRATLNADADTNLADNGVGAITAAEVRGLVKDLADSARLAEDLGTAAEADASDFATAAQGALADTAVQPGQLGNSASRNVGTTAGTVAAGDDSRFHAVVTLTGSLDYLTLSGQQITRGAIDLTTDVSGVLPAGNLPDAGTSAEGIVELATAAEYRTGTDTGRALNVAEVWDSADLSALTDATTISVNFASGFNFGAASNAPLTLGGNRTLGAPSNVSKNQAGILWFTASATRTLTLNAAWTLADGVETGPYSIASGEVLGIAYVVRGSTVIVTAIIRKAP